jgi:HD-GYP domain-containing protein (c-di-GMP phosphodiesterase class II)
MLPTLECRPPESCLGGRHDVTLLYPFEQGMTPTELAMLQVLVDDMTNYDEDICAHARRMVPWAQKVAQRLHLSPAQTLMTCLGTLLHDVGKRGIPLAILHKKGPLDQNEWVLMRQHTDIGYSMLADCGGIFAAVAPIVRAHHERWDGSGYPLGLAYENIPLSARIISVLDSYDAITSCRPYAPARIPQEACRELLRCAGSYYQPLVVAAALPVLTMTTPWPVPRHPCLASMKMAQNSVRRDHVVSVSA